MTAAPRWHLWLSILFLIWNLFGIFAFISDWSMTPEALAALPKAQRDLWQATPLWSWAAWAVAVGSGTIAAIGLLRCKSWAVMMFAFSLIATLILFGFPFLIQGAYAKGGMAMAAFPIFIITMGFVEWIVSRRWRKRGFLA